jgi:hypothetical protein
VLIGRRVGKDAGVSVENEASLNWCFSSGIVVVGIHGMGVSMVLLCVWGSCINGRY